jgi:hypothetical protein
VKSIEVIAKPTDAEIDPTELSIADLKNVGRQPRLKPFSAKSNAST